MEEKCQTYLLILKELEWTKKTLASIGRSKLYGKKMNINRKAIVYHVERRFSRR